ncbi:MAG: hypothetical protein CL868_04400 [Cytophagaceae bacterium]|nr:hypothetical protein [Cytophagaceae bacterium]|tara:strand:- start:2300 stop:3160 length:861 start_codon:yes stop_codon:yes gene_type:complete
MDNFNIADVLSISREEYKTWVPREERSDVYLQVIFIENGHGTYRTQGDSITYRPQNVFLVPPNTPFEFTISEASTITIVSFRDKLFSTRLNFPDREYWLRHIEFILQKMDIKPGHFIENNRDAELIWKLYALIMREREAKREFYMQVVSNMISTILSIISRNLYVIREVPKVNEKKELIEEIVDYIHKHVYEPHRMKIAALADRFNMTSSTMSNYFKRHTGKSLHHFILLYKLDIIKHRLRTTDFTVSQISAQLGFTDESHLTRIFKKYEEVTPRQYKEHLQEVAE